jgi:hypothetical protein
MGRIFLSYRRQDAAGHARLLFQALKARFPGQVFMDLGGEDGIGPGEDFEVRIEAALARTNVLLAVIGPRWLDARNDLGRRRLDDPRDHLRLEIATALRRGLDIFPVLVGGARMPTAEELPEDLRALAKRQAHTLVDDHGWDDDVRYLADAIRRKIEGRTALRALGGALLCAAALAWPARAAGEAVTNTWEMHRDQFTSVAAAARLGLSHGASFAILAAAAALGASLVVRGTRSAGSALLFGALAGLAGGLVGGALDQATRARTTMELGLVAGFAVSGAIAATGGLAGFKHRSAIAGGALGAVLGTLVQMPVDNQFLAFATPGLLIVAGSGLLPLALRGPSQGDTGSRREPIFH